METGEAIHGAADFFLGVPFNIASYALLQSLLARACGCMARTFTHTFGDVHLYSDHIEQAKLQLSREPRSLPDLHLAPGAAWDGFDYDSVVITSYNPYPSIKARVSV